MLVLEECSHVTLLLERVVGLWLGLVLLTGLKPSHVLCHGCNQCSMTIAVRR